MNAKQFWNPFDFQPTKFTSQSLAREETHAVLGDYYRRAMKTDVFPKQESDFLEDKRTVEQKAKEAGKEHITKSERKMPRDERPDPYAEFLREPLPNPMEQIDKLDTYDPYGARAEVNSTSLPRIEDERRALKKLRPKKPPKLLNQLPKFRRTRKRKQTS